MKPKNIIIVSILIFLTAAVCLLSRLSLSRSENDIRLENTANAIEATRPVGILYLYSTITHEDAKDSF